MQEKKCLVILPWVSFYIVCVQCVCEKKCLGEVPSCSLKK